ncbi:MAG: aspartate 1-decarboxylase [Deltaproteobacteria bacterium RIFCSPLOWO2_02_FULL_46_8]|nr:MAG: aspartate 1-decarboxylase [Deltaproteobacteria bacterium RIFCSPLOWO2_02_FULL_46_8]
MQRRLLKSKIHRACVTDANLAYEGSVTLDSKLMEAADILPWEMVHIWDVTSGSRIITYAIPGKENSGVVCINGAAAHHVKVGDTVIIATFGEYEENVCRTHNPKRILVDEKNKIL